MEIIKKVSPDSLSLIEYQNDKEREGNIQKEKERDDRKDQAWHFTIYWENWNLMGETLYGV